MQRLLLCPHALIVKQDLKWGSQLPELPQRLAQKQALLVIHFRIHVRTSLMAPFLPSPGLCSMRFNSVQSLSRVRLFETPWNAAREASLSITNSLSSLRLSPSSQWCQPSISSSVIPFSSCPQFPPASESFPMSQLFTWGGQSTGVSALASFLPKKSQG